VSLSFFVNDSACTVCPSSFSVIVDFSILFHRYLSYQREHRTPAKVRRVFVRESLCFCFRFCFFSCTSTPAITNSSRHFMNHNSLVTRFLNSHAVARASCTCCQLLSPWHRSSTRPSLQPWCEESTVRIGIIIFFVIFAPGVPFITLVGLSLDALKPYLPSLKQLPMKRGETHVQFSWESAHAPASRIRWMAAEDGRSVL
jgi:hypothetical protein